MPEGRLTCNSYIIYGIGNFFYPDSTLLPPQPPQAILMQLLLSSYDLWQCSSINLSYDMGSQQGDQIQKIGLESNPNAENLEILQNLKLHPHGSFGTYWPSKKKNMLRVCMQKWRHKTDNILFTCRIFTRPIDPNSIFQVESSPEMVFTTAIPIISYSNASISFFLHLTAQDDTFL